MYYSISVCTGVNSLLMVLLMLVNSCCNVKIVSDLDDIKVKLLSKPGTMLSVVSSIHEYVQSEKGPGPGVPNVR